jgi:UDP-glucose 4-epimerase
VYGAPKVLPVAEETELAPMSPYGTSKLMTEWMLRDLSASRPDFRYVALRYFNVAGAQIAGGLGQTVQNATHLIKVACEAACGVRSKVEILGTDYSTPDGTGIRDYIHVEDLARAHLDAIAYLDQGGASQVLNCGYGHGFSVREVLAVVKKVSGVDFPIVESPRRPGDSPAVVSQAARIGKVLGWKPQYDDLEIICRTAFEWEKKLRAKS